MTRGSGDVVPFDRLRAGSTGDFGPAHQRVGAAMASERLRKHNVTLQMGPVRLRPLNEDDWDLVVGLWNDPEIAYYSRRGAEDVYDRAGAGDCAGDFLGGVLFRYRV